MSRKQALVAVAFCLTICACAASFLVYFTNSKSEAAARRRWQNRPFNAYRLELVYRDYVDCRQIFDIVNEQIVATIENNCARPDRTVPNLFQTIEAYRMQYSDQCGPGGCGCSGPLIVVVDYDEAWGYPRSAMVRTNDAVRWWYPEFWTRAECSGAHFFGARFDARVTPLQEQ